MAGLTATGKPPCCGVGSLCPSFCKERVPEFMQKFPLDGTLTRRLARDG